MEFELRIRYVRNVRLEIALMMESVVLRLSIAWPLHDIAIADIVWCMAYTRVRWGGAYVAQ